MHTPITRLPGKVVVPGTPCALLHAPCPQALKLCITSEEAAQIKEACVMTRANEQRQHLEKLRACPGQTTLVALAAAMRRCCLSGNPDSKKKPLPKPLPKPLRAPTTPLPWRKNNSSSQC